MLADQGKILNVARAGTAARNLKKWSPLRDVTKMLRYVRWGKGAIDERAASIVWVTRKSMRVSFSR
jgi:hypothetical protein